MEGKCVAVMPFFSLYNATALLWRQAAILHSLQLKAVTSMTLPQHAR